MSNIEYLYRYTSLESLALILKSRQIRLNPLDKMDDLQEQKTADVENLGKFVFISSWTEESDEHSHVENVHRSKSGSPNQNEEEPICVARNKRLGYC